MCVCVFVFMRGRETGRKNDFETANAAAAAAADDVVLRLIHKGKRDDDN